MQACFSHGKSHESSQAHTFMEPIQSSLKKWMQENKNFQERHQQIKQEVLSDPGIKKFLASHPELSEKEIDKSLINLFEYKDQSKQCSNCNSLNGCKNIIKGYSPLLDVVNGEIHLSYEKCKYLLENEKQSEQKDLIQSLYMPKEILNASIDNLHTNDMRRSALRDFYKFLNDTKSGLPARGIYFHGSFGVGKTYLLGVLANELKKKDISSMLIYMPEFVLKIRESIKDDSVNEKVEQFKGIDVLMLDDIGAETQSAWFRDEILGSILQYRMMENLPVFFTSNYSLDQLEKQLAKTTRGGVEEVKAGRILERIKQVSKEVQLFGDNLRN